MRPNRTSHSDPDAMPTSRGVVGLIAVLEELVFRGFLLSACLQVNSTAGATVAIVGLVAAFGLSHIWFGWIHVLAKLPLGAIATIAVLWIGGVVVSVVAHLVFSLRVAHHLALGSRVAQRP